MKSALNIEQKGQGASLVLLHGWGMNAHIWGEFADILAENFKVISVELPGHGNSSHDVVLTLDMVIEQLQKQITEPAHWLGWSLGGLFLIRLAMLMPAQVKTLSLIASSPCFVQRKHWQSAMQLNVLQQFADSLQQDTKKTLMRFIALQAMAADTGSQTLKSLKKNLSESPLPNSQSLTEGLSILRDTDLREALEKVSVPVQVLLGEHDKLVPQSLGEYVQQKLPRADLVIVKGSGHAPFISHPKLVAEKVHHFIQAQQA